MIGSDRNPLTTHLLAAGTLLSLLLPACATATSGPPADHAAATSAAPPTAAPPAVDLPIAGGALDAGCNHSAITRYSD